MHKSDDHIFESLSESMENFSIPVDDQLWESVESELGLVETDDQRRYPIWWIFSFSFLLTFIFILFSSLNQNSNDRTHTDNSTLGNSHSSDQSINPVQNQRLALAEQSENQEFSETSRFPEPSQRTHTDVNLSMTDAINNRRFPESQNIFEITPSPSLDEEHASTEESSNPLFDHSKADQTSNHTETDTIREASIISPESSEKSSITQKKITISKWSLLVNGGPGFSYRNLKSNSSQGLVSHRNSHETYSTSYGVELSLSYALQRNNFLRFGIGYGEFSENYSFHHDLITHDTKNTYSYGNIAVYFGHRLFTKGRSHLSFLTGAKINRLLSAQSSWVDPTLFNAVQHSSAHQNQPFQEWNGLVNLSLDYQFDLSPNWSVHFIPSLDAFINSSYKKETTLQQRPYSLLFTGGISYRFISE